VTDRQIDRHTEDFSLTFLNKKKLHKTFQENSDCLPEYSGRRSKSAPATVVVVVVDDGVGTNDVTKYALPVQTIYPETSVILVNYNYNYN